MKFVASQTFVKQLNPGEKMANVTLFPMNQEPMNFPNATGTYVQDGVLYFRGKREPSAPAQNAFTTNLPFLLMEEE